MAGISGIKLDTAALDKLAAHLNTNVSTALRRAATQAYGIAADLAPYDTGALSNTLRMDRDSELLYTIYDQVEYGIWQELGTSKMGAQPFMTPAIERVSGQIGQMIAEVITK